jgi:hypothetical protein
MHLIEDATKRPLQIAMPRAGGTVILSVTAAAAVAFQPTLIELTNYDLFTTGDVRFAVHNDDYTFDPAENAVLLPGDIQTINLGDSAGRWTTLTLQSVVGTVNVTITELQ